MAELHSFKQRLARVFLAKTALVHDVGFNNICTDCSSILNIIMSSSACVLDGLSTCVFEWLVNWLVDSKFTCWFCWISLHKWIRVMGNVLQQPPTFQLAALPSSQPPSLDIWAWFSLINPPPVTCQSNQGSTFCFAWSLLFEWQALVAWDVSQYK